MPFALRWIPFVAWHCCLAAVVLSLITLLAGANGGSSLESGAIIMFNTSSLGLAELNAPNSTLHSAIISLLPTSLPTNTSSITQYLGIKDWYSLHYLSICSGFYTPSTTYPINISCTQHTSGYTFSLQDTLRSELYSSVKGLADEVSQRSYYTASWVALLYIGLICGILELGLMPWTWLGTRRLNGYVFLLALIGYVTLQISSSLATTHSLIAHHNAFNITDPSISPLPIPSPSHYAATFFALTWSATACMIVVFILQHFEWRFELWTLKGERITIYRKPMLKSWGLMDSWNVRKPLEIEDRGYEVGEEGIELR